MSGVGIEELCGSRLTTRPCSIIFHDVNPQEDAAKIP